MTSSSNRCRTEFWRTTTSIQGGFTRAFALDPSGNILIATNLMEIPVRNAKGVSVLPASLAVFRVRRDGKLDFVRKYDVAVGSRNMFWMGITALP